MKKALIALGITALLAGCGTDVPTKPIEDREPKNIGEATEETPQAASPTTEPHTVSVVVAISGMYATELEDGGCKSGGPAIRDFDEPQIKVINQSGDVVGVGDLGPGEKVDGSTGCYKTAAIQIPEPDAVTFFTLRLGTSETVSYPIDMTESYQSVAWEMTP